MTISNLAREAAEKIMTYVVAGPGLRELIEAIIKAAIHESHNQRDQSTADKDKVIGTLAGIAEGLLVRAEHDFECATRKRTGPFCDCSLITIKGRIDAAMKEGKE